MSNVLNLHKQRLVPTSSYDALSGLLVHTSPATLPAPLKETGLVVHCTWHCMWRMRPLVTRTIVWLHASAGSM